MGYNRGYGQSGGKPKKPGEIVESALMVPRDNEVLGRVTKISGASRFVVMCTDNKERTCSIPGRYRRKFWIKVNDVVLVKPWAVQGDEKGDIVWRYSLMDIGRLKDRKLIN